MANPTLWFEVSDGDDRARGIYKRHYSARHYRDGRKPRLFVGPGEKMVLLTKNCDALFIWRKFIDKSDQSGVNCAAFRNEGMELSSNLIIEAEQLAKTRWPHDRFYTYINPKKIKSANPGYCFLKAGWCRSGVTKGGLIILERYSELAANRCRQMVMELEV